MKVEAQTHVSRSMVKVFPSGSLLVFPTVLA